MRPAGPLRRKSPSFWRRGAAGAERPELVVGVHCPGDIRRERLRRDRKWDDEMFAAVESWQWPEADKMRGCDLVVDNSGGEKELERKARGLLRILAETRRGKARRLDSAMRELLAASREPAF